MSSKSPVVGKGSVSTQLKELLQDLDISDKWLSSGAVDENFVVSCHKLLSEAEVEHVRTKFYAKLINDRETNGFSNQDIELYLSLVALERDHMLKSWAVGFLVESKLLTLNQLVSLRQNSLLEEKHKYFLEREIIEKNI